MTYKVSLTKQAAKQLEKLPKKIQKALAIAIDDLTRGLNHNCKKLVGLQNTYRLRAGDYQIVFQVQHGQLFIIVIRIAHRRDVYRQK